MSNAMKKSQIPFVDSIPITWKEIDNRYLFTNTPQKVGERFSQYQLLSLTTKGVAVKDITATGGKIPQSYEAYQTVEPNQMIFCLFDLDCSAVFSGLSVISGMITSAYDVCYVNKYLLPKFADYWFAYVFFNRSYKMFSKNIRYTITYDTFKSIKTPVPPINTQKQIVEILDKKCEEIVKLISIEEKSIETLKAYKQSVITEAVTKGIRPNRPTKPSGIDWIGDIPEDWEVVGIKPLFIFGKGLPITKENLVESGLKVISYGQIHAKYNKSVVATNEVFRFVDKFWMESNSQSLVSKDDFIFADTSEDLLGVGDFVRIDSEDTIFAGYHTIIFSAKVPNYSHFLAYLFLSDLWRGQFRSRVNGVKLFSVTLKILREGTVILPPQLEQQEIADYLDEKCAAIDKLIAAKQAKIEKLNEYKKSLIYEYVTGKREIEQCGING